MVKQSLKFMMAATLLVVSGSFAKADTYQVNSTWDRSGDVFTGNGTFDWDGSTFSNISFNFTGDPSSPYTNVYFFDWTATSNDGEINSFLGPNTLVLGDNPSGNDWCVRARIVSRSSCLAHSTLGATLPLTSTVGSEEDSNQILVSATISDVKIQGTNSGAVPEPSAVGLLCAVSGLLGVVIFRRRKLVF